MRSSYSAGEVTRLVSCYAELRERKGTTKGGLHTLVCLADIDRAIAHMPPKEYHAILLHGQLGHTVRDAEQLLGVAKSTLEDRFKSGITWITNYLNGDNPE